MSKESNAKIEKAFTAGFKDENIVLDDDAGLGEKSSAAEIAAEANGDLDLEGVVTKVEKEEKEVDPWEGVSPAVKAHMEELEAKLEKSINVANSASGRANKLQSQIDKQLNQKPVVKTQPTSDQLLAAMTSSEKRKKLGDDFPDFAVVLDEMDRSVSTSVGAAIDGLRTELRAEASNNSTAVSKDFEIKRNLDNVHPGWEDTVHDEECKTWVYEGGPSKQESAYYDSLLTQAAQAAPQEAANLYDSANRYYGSLIQSYPVWADKKGSAYGDSSGSSAIELLTSYKKDKPPAPGQRAQEQETNSTFEDNLTPTSGQSRQAPAAPTEDVEKAFSDGFNS